LNEKRLRVVFNINSVRSIKHRVSPDAMEQSI
jgi:hypothetical protein